jgi:TubC N-terminal docking domain
VDQNIIEVLRHHRHDRHFPCLRGRFAWPEVRHPRAVPPEACVISHGRVTPTPLRSDSCPNGGRIGDTRLTNAHHHADVSDAKIPDGSGDLSNEIRDCCRGKGGGTEPMTAIELLTEVRQRGIHMTAQGDPLRLDAPNGAVTPELREALIARKEELLSLLIQPPTAVARGSEPESPANIPEAGEPIVAVKVWSDILGEAVWVVTSDVPRTDWPTDAPVYTHAEVKLLTLIGPDTVGWVHSAKELFGARVVDAGKPQKKGETADGRRRRV